MTYADGVSVAAQMQHNKDWKTLAECLCIDEHVLRRDWYRLMNTLTPEQCRELQAIAGFSDAA